MAPDYNGIKLDSNSIKISNDNWITWADFRTTGSTGSFTFTMPAEEYKAKVLGIWDKHDDVCDSISYGFRGGSIPPEEERNDNMNILELYEKRKKEELKDYYNDSVDAEYSNLDVVKEYRELIENFKINMKQLAEKYNTDDNIYLVRTGYIAEYNSYEISENVKYEIEKKYRKEYDDELDKLNKLVEEVRASLSLSDDKDYQLEVLRNYDIIDKKGKLTI